MSTAQGKAGSGGVENRLDPRVAGPFDGRRVDLLSTPIRIHDLSRSGCLIQWYHDQTPGLRFTLEMELTEKVDPGFYFFNAITSIYPADEGAKESFIQKPIGLGP